MSGVEHVRNNSGSSSSAQVFQAWFSWHRRWIPNFFDPINRVKSDGEICCQAPGSVHLIFRMGADQYICRVNGDAMQMVEVGSGYTHLCRQW